MAAQVAVHALHSRPFSRAQSSISTRAWRRLGARVVIPRTALGPQPLQDLRKLQTMSEGDVRAGDAGVRGLQQHTACITVEADAFPPAKKEIKDVDMSPALL